MNISAARLAGITVVGERGAQLRSISEQRASETVINTVSADEIGSLPDQNVAEGVQRLAGVSIQTNRGEGRFVSIRGTAPRLNTVTLNGQTLATPGDSRAVQLDMLPADMITSVQVTKAVTPDMDANSVGGNINISTLTAFDRDRPFLMGSIEGMRHVQQVDYLDNKQPFEASLTAGRRFGADGTFGLVVGGNASRRDFGVSVLDPDGWDEVEDAETGETRIFPEEIELQVEDNERTRYGLNTSLDWRPSSRSSLALRGLFTHTREVTSNSEFEFGFEGDLVNSTATGGRFTEGSAELDLSEHDNKSTLYALSLIGERRLTPSLSWNVSGTYTRAKRDGFEPDGTFETIDEAMLSSTLDISQYFFRINPDNVAFVSDPSTYPLRSMNFNTERDRERAVTVATDLRWDMNLGAFPASLKFGVKAQVRDKTEDDDSDRYSTGDEGTLLSPFAIPTQYTVQGGYTGYVHGNTRIYSDFAEQNRGNPAILEFNEYDTARESAEDDQESHEDIYAGFLMGTVEMGRLTLLGGARLERTVTEATRRPVLDDEGAETIQLGPLTTVDKSYTHVLPSVILRYAAGEKVVLRAAWTNTIGRPDYDEFGRPRNTTFEETAQAGRYEGVVNEGSIDLKPYEAMNLDLTAEYYFATGGVLSVAGFHKQIDNPIFQFRRTERDIVFEGLTFDELEFIQDRNADEATLRGVELSYAQPLVFLPGLLNGLGITVNAAFIDSDVTVPGRENDNLPFFEQSERIINLIPYYQRGPIELRVAMTHRDDYLDEIGEESFEDRYIEGRTTWDLSGKYRFRDGRLELFGQARNLTNEPEVGYQGIRSHFDLHVLTGRTFSLGLRTRF
jgi:TonB-dependent receptor